MRICPFCKRNIVDTAVVCPLCHANLAGIPVQMDMPQINVPYVGAKETNGLAIGSLICGIFFLILPSALVAVILGHISRSQIRKSQGRQTGEGMALAGLILGYMGLSVIPILIIAAIVIPNVLRAKMAANEASAVGSLRAYNTAMITYERECPKNGYPERVENLGPGKDGDCEEANLLDKSLGTSNAVKNGYRFIYLAGEKNSEGIVTEYTIEADPIAKNATGARHFYTDQTGMIRFSKIGAADANSEPLQ